MWYFIIPVFIVILTFIGFIGITAHSCAKNENNVNNQINNNSKLSKKDISQRLLNLSKKPAPKKLSVGAMCYKVAVTPLRAEYICPVCGEKTLYADYKDTDIVNRIPTYRNMIKNIKGLDIKLDESEFCKKCRPEMSSPQICLIIRYNEGAKIHRVCNINDNDIRLITEFTEGKDIHKSGNDGESPLKDYLERLQQLLGTTLPE